MINFQGTIEDPWWLAALRLEEVVPVRQMIEDFLEVADVPRLWELQRVECLKKNPVGMWRNRRNVCPVTSIEKAETSLLLSSLKR
jgi:hypothetical protein